jgi:hypothetical protein
MAKKSQIWRRSIWRTEVGVRVRELTNRLDAAIASAGEPDEQQKAAKAAVESSLEKAQDTLDQEQTRWGGLVSWWTGDTIATAWEAVHEAEFKLVRLEEADAVKANLPWLLSWIQGAMEKGKRRSSYEKALEDQERKDPPLDLTQIEQAYRDVIVANSDRYANLRAFRNNLVLVTGVLLTLVCGLAIWHAWNAGVMTLCSNQREDGVVHCLDGTTSHGWDVALVALVGAIGGMLAIAFGLTNAETLPYRYDPRTWQVLLKPVAGAATALAGVLFIQSNLLISPAGTRSESVLLAYALLFGFSQQLFTQFVDKRAGSLIETDGKESKDATKN